MGPVPPLEGRQSLPKVWPVWQRFNIGVYGKTHSALEAISQRPSMLLTQGLALSVPKTWGFTSVKKASRYPLCFGRYRRAKVGVLEETTRKVPSTQCIRNQGTKGHKLTKLLGVVGDIWGKTPTEFGPGTTSGRPSIASQSMASLAEV